MINALQSEMIIRKAIDSLLINDDNLNSGRYSPAGYHDHLREVSFFQICYSCSWSTSALDENKMYKVCPVCTSAITESIPISPNEAFTYDLNGSAGLSLSFKLFDPKL